MFKRQIAWFVVLIVAAISAFVYYLPILRTTDALGIQDWDQNFAWSEVTRLAILHHHQFPFWDPYRCGGAVHFANPQIGVLSLQTIFVLIFGSVFGLKISIFIHGLIGFIGCFLLARQHRLSWRAAVVSSIIFSYSGVVSSYLSTGMIVFISFAFVPYILLLYNKGLDDRRWLVAAAGSLALSFYSGYHIALLLLVYICVFTLIKSFWDRNIHYFYSLLIFVCIFLIFSAPKLALALELYSIFPATSADISGYTLRSFLHALVSRTQGLVDGKTVMWGIDEASLYVGILPVFLSIIFFFRNGRAIRRHVALLLSLVVVIIFMFGSNFPISLYDLLHSLPIFSSFRMAQRFRFVFIIIFSLIAGMGFDRLTEKIKSPALSRAVFLLFVAVIYLDLAHLSAENFFKLSLPIRHPAALPSSRFSQTDSYDAYAMFSYRKGIIPEGLEYTFGFVPGSLEYPAIRQNTGVIDCYDSITGARFALGNDSPLYRGEWFTESEGYTITQLSWSPNVLSFAVSANDNGSPDDMLVINQNYYPGWYVQTDGTITRAENYYGLIAAPITKESRTVTFRFLPYRNILTGLLPFVR